MNVRLTLSKKTYYALGMLSAALTMAAALGAAVRFPMALAENLATLLTLLMLGFLASVKGTTKQDKKLLQELEDESCERHGDSEKLG